MRVALLLLVACSLWVTARAEDPPAAAPAAAVPHATSEITNTAWLAALRAYAAGHGLAVVEKGAGPVRFLLVGGADPGDLKHPLELATRALGELEAATGTQETFTSKTPAPGEIYWLTLFASGDQVDGFIDAGRAQGFIGQPEAGGEDLLKKVKAFSGSSRVYTAPLDKVKPLLEEWTVYATSCLALDAFYQARSPDPKKRSRGPTWIREGWAADLQRQFCKRVACTTIAYEDHQFPMSEDWRRDVANLMKANDRQNKPASELMRMGLEALPSVYYQQMWSLCSFMRELCGQPKKGAKSKFREILEATANGSSSEEAVKAVFGKVDPALTVAWRQWAQSSR